jgi:integrase
MAKSVQSSGQTRVLIRLKNDRADLVLYYVDPDTGREVSRTAGTSDRGDAERAAALWEQELGIYRGTGDGWKYFRDRFRDEHLANLSPKSQAIFRTALDSLQRVMNPHTVSGISPTMLSVYQSKLTEDGLRIASVATYLTHIRAALNWAAGVGIIQSAPRVKLPKQHRREFMRGRPLTQAEFDLMLAACPSDAYRRLLGLLWRSGMRLGEAMLLAWDAPPVQLSMDAKPVPLILFHAEGHKSRRDEAVPMTPELYDWLAETPEAERVGLVAPITIRSVPRASEAITKIGKAAGVKVNATGKAASAHDLRRSFATRWAQKVMPPVLRMLMRHGDLSTTLRYYVGISTADAAQAIWGERVNLKDPKA